MLVHTNQSILKNKRVTVGIQLGLGWLLGQNPGLMFFFVEATAQQLIDLTWHEEQQLET